MLRSLFIILLCVNAAAGFSQLQQPYLFSYLGMRRGLASDEISKVQQDERGFIWIASNNGIQRFDGRRFIGFHAAAGNPAFIPDDDVKDIYMGSRNRLWVLCAGNRTGYLDVRDFKFHPVPVRFPMDSLKKANGTLFAGNNGEIMLLLRGSTMLVYRESANEFSVAESMIQLPTGWKPLSISADHTNNYWIGCDSGLVKYNVGKKSISNKRLNTEQDMVLKAFSAQHHISATCFDRSGKFWLVSNTAVNNIPVLYSYTPGSNKLVNHSAQVHDIIKKARYSISGILEQGDGTIWIMGTNLLARFNPVSNAFDLVESNLPGEFSIRYDIVQSLFEDREKSLWTSTNMGLYRFNPAAQFFNTFINKRFDKEMEHSSNVTNIYQLRNEDVLVNTDGDGVFAYDRHFKPLNAGYIDPAAKGVENNAYCILERPNGDIWKALRNGSIDIYHAAGKTKEKLKPEIFGPNPVVQMAADLKGNVWLATNEGLLVKWDAVLNNFLLIQKLNGNINKLYADDKGYLWICTATSGVYRINTVKGTIVAHYTSAGKEGEKLIGAGAVEILQYNDSIFLIASDGLNVLNIHTNQFTYFSKENGQLTNNVSNIVKDRMGYIWVTAKPWICSINLDKKVVTTYDERDGVHTNAFNTASGCLLKDGRIAIGTSHDIMVFDPAIANESAHKLPPDVTITGFSVMNKWLSMDSISKLPYIELDPDQNSFTIELSTLSFQTIYGYFYMLEELDKDWRISAQQNQVTYNYLPPGTYTFKAMCMNGDGTSSQKIVALKIRVKPVFWKTWWFYSLVVITLVGLIYWFDKERMKRKESMQKIRSDIAGNLHQEINVALNNINILSEMARIKTDTDPAKSKEYIEQIHTKSHQMIIAMDDMLWSLSPDNDNMQKTVERMKEYIDALQNRHGVHIGITIDKKVESLELNMKLRHEAFLLFKEGIRSLVQAGTRHCEIHIGLEKNSLQFTMQFENANCDMQQLNNLLHRQDLEKEMRSLQATFNVQVHKTNSVFSLMIPVE